MKKILIILLVVCQLAHAQRGSLRTHSDSIALCSSENPQLESMTIMSPNAYAFARYGDVPVDYSTGKTNISLPLGSISARDLNVDVSLNYYGGGIKVDQEAGTVGLGWSLFAGGVITREVNGNPDGFNYQGKFVEHSKIRMYSDIGETDFVRNEFSKIEQARLSGAEDPAPDVFTYNFCGNVGKFYLDDEGKGVVVNHNEYKIQMQCQKEKLDIYEYFKIIDDKGIEYIFDAGDGTYMSGENSVTTSWYLSSMVSPTGDSIKFEYQSGGVLSKNLYLREYSSASFAINVNVSEHEYPYTYKTNMIYNYGYVWGAIPSKISSSDGTRIEFLYKSGRKDAEYNKGDMLDKVIFYNSLGNVIKSYAMSYDYFEAVDARKTKLQGMDFLNYRLKLCSVQECSSDGKNTLPPYRFEYNGDDGKAVYLLPYRMSPSQDGWGYYNDRNNVMLFPNNSRSDGFHADSWYQRLQTYPEDFWVKSSVVTGGADRSFNPDAMQACMLNKIVYPTGGYESFEYESHEINNAYYSLGYGGVRIKQITTCDGMGNYHHRTFEYGTPEEPVSCGVLENQYFTYFVQGQENGVGKYREFLLAYGVSPELIDEPYVLLVKANPMMKLGIEAGFYYPYVTENIDDEKQVSYTYSSFSLEPSLDVAPYQSSSLFIYKSPGIIPDMWEQGDVGLDVFPYMDDLNARCATIKLTEKNIADKNGKELSRDEYVYENEVLGAKAGYKSMRIADEYYIVGCNYIANGYLRLAKEIHAKDRVSTNVQYEYSTELPSRLISKKTDLSNGQVMTEKYYYPSDYGSICSSLVAKNIVSPLDIRSYVGGKLVSGIQAQLNDYGQVATLYKYDGNGQDVSFSKSNPYTFSPYINKEYDTNSHVLLSEYFTKENRKYCYIWSYNNVYPIAKMEMCGKDMDESLYRQLQQVMGQKLNPTNSDYETMRQKLDAVSNVNYTLFKYIPSVGISETIDSRNVRYQYDYDSFYRLAKKKLLIGTKEYTLEGYDIHFKQ